MSEEWLKMIVERIDKLEQRCDTFNKLDTDSARVEQDLQKEIKKLKERVNALAGKDKQYGTVKQSKDFKKVSHAPFDFKTPKYMSLEEHNLLMKYQKQEYEDLRIRYKELEAKEEQEAKYSCNKCGTYLEKLSKEQPDGAKIECPTCGSYYIDWGLGGKIFHPKKEAEPDEILKSKGDIALAWGNYEGLKELYNKQIAEFLKSIRKTKELFLDKDMLKAGFRYGDDGYAWIKNRFLDLEEEWKFKLK